MPPAVAHITSACFGASYLLAFGLELAGLRLRRPGFRAAGTVAAGLGLVAHTAYLVAQHPTPATPRGALLAVAWVLAVFTLYGTLHAATRAWAVFGLPVVLGLVGLAAAAGDDAAGAAVPPWLVGTHVWGAAHGLLVLGAAVGLAVGCLASGMYLAQARRLRAKSAPGGGVRLLSLERLEAMNRRAVNAAFPLLTLGLVLGAVLSPGMPDPAGGWLSVKVVGTVGLWAVCVLLFYLRQSTGVPGRRLALLTILAFGVAVVVLAAAHPFAPAAAAPVAAEDGGVAP